MSSIDNRIVEMQFNNKRFEKNARESMSTLDKLKEKLNFRSSTKELNDFQNAADSFNLSHIASAIDEIGNKFTLLGNLGQQAMQRIANAAIDAGMSMIKSISVDQISTGFSKYEQETNSVQALYAALKPKGKTLEDIYAGMDILAAYSDETSYSYTQMADGVSKFVSAGQDFDKSIIVMEGIANAAAKGGVSIQDAAIAFRNFSDAMGKGSFQLKDWYSIMNIHMDTEEFKNTVLETAAELGKIEKDAEGNFWIKTTGKGKKQKKEQITATNFADYLRYDFFDSDVIMATMMKYADTTTEFGEEAYLAAQQAKTFTDVIDAIGDSVSTKWKQSFKIIFGDLNEAIELFTPMANKVIEFTSAIGDFRNAVLTKWKEAGGRDSLIGTLNNLWDAFSLFTGEFKFAFFDVFHAATLEEMDSLGALDFIDYLGKKLAQTSERIKNATQAFKNWLNGSNTADGYRRIAEFRSIFAGVLSVVNTAKMALEGIGTFIGEIFKQLEPTFDAILSFLGLLGKDILGLNTDLKKQKGFTELAKNLAGIFEPLTKRLPAIINKLKEFYNKLKDIWNNNKRVVAFRKSIRRVFDTFIKFIPKAIESLIGFGKRIFDVVKNSDEWKWLVENYNKYIKPVVKFISDAATKFNNALGDFFDMDTSDTNTLWGKIKKRFSAFDNLGPWLAEKWEAAKKQIPFLQDIENWWNTDPIINEIKAWVAKISEGIDSFLSEDTSSETSIVGKIKMRFAAMWDTLGPFFEEKWNEYKTKWPILQQIEDFLGNLFGWGKPAENAASETEQQTEKTTSFLQKAWDKIQEFVSKIDPGKLLLFGVAIKVLISVYKKIKTLAGWASIGEQIGGTIEEIGKTFKEARKSMKKTNMVATVQAILGVAVAMWLLGKTLMEVSQLSWEEIGKGLTAMGGLFIETGAFMVLVSKLSKANNGVKGLKFTQLLGIGVSMWLLGKALMNVSQLGWEEIGRGLTAMGGLFVEEGAFIILVNKFGSVNKITQKAGTSATSMIGLALNMKLLGDTLKDLASLTWEEIGKGLTAMGGLFIEEGAFIILVNKFGSVNKITQKAGTSATSMIGLALNMKLLGDTLKSLASLTWEEIGRGLTAMGGLFVEEGAFIILVNRFGSVSKLKTAGTNAISMVAMAINMKSLGDTLKNLASLTWDEIGRGLTAMGGVFTEEGAFMTVMGLLKKKNLIDPNAANPAGIVAGGIGVMGQSMAQLGQLNIDQILKGALAIAAIEILLGAFVGVMSMVKTIKIGSAFSMVLVAAAMYLMAQAFVPLTKLSLKQILKGVVALAAIAIALGVFCLAVSGLKMSIKTGLGVLVSAIALAALMVAFAFALTLVKDVDPKTVIAFGAAMVGVSAAMLALSNALAVFSKISLGAALKGTAVMLIAATGLAAAVALILLIVGGAVESFSNNIAVVGANLAQYSDQVANIDMTAVSNSVDMLLMLSSAFVVIGTRDYGNLDTFRTNLTRMGASLKLFGLNTAEIDTEKMKTIVSAMKDMATDLSGFPEVSDVGTSIGNIGGAIKLYSDSLNGVDLSAVPDTSSIQLVFNTLRDALPDDEDLTNVAEYASEDKGNQMTNFAIGLTNIATAVSTFSDTAKTLDFTNINSAITALTSISSLNTGLKTTEVTAFGPFAMAITTENLPLSTFAEDIVSLGTALKDFGTNIAAVNVDDLKTGTTVLKEITKVNKALPKTGGISQWFTGTQNLTNFAANLRLLGGGAKEFGTAVSGSDFDANSVSAAGDALIKIAEVNKKLPKTGGISSWFTGDESLSGFGSSLKQLGTGVKDFAEAFGETKITTEMTDAIGMISKIASIQIKLGNAESWYSMNALGSELNEAAGFFVELNDKINGVTEWADTSGFENILSFATDQQVKLGSTSYKKSLKNIGQDLKDFFNEIWNFTKDWVGNDNGKLTKVSDAVTGIFNSLNEALTNVNTDEDYTASGLDVIKGIVDGITSETSKTKVTKAVKDTVTAICKIVHPGSDTSLSNAGTWIPVGFAAGVTKNQHVLINTVKSLAATSLRTFRVALGINSPSKEFEELGMYSDLGLAKGLNDSVDAVEQAGKNVSKSAIGSVLDDMAEIQNLPLDDMDLTPTIRPVLDTSDISNRARMIDGMLGGARSIGFNTRQLEEQAQILGDTTAPDLSAITQRVSDLGTKLDELGNAIANMKIVMNNGALVGAIASDMDKALGARGKAAERGG